MRFILLGAMSAALAVANHAPAKDDHPAWTYYIDRSCPKSVKEAAKEAIDLAQLATKSSQVDLHLADCPTCNEKSPWFRNFEVQPGGGPTSPYGVFQQIAKIKKKPEKKLKKANIRIYCNGDRRWGGHAWVRRPINAGGFSAVYEDKANELLVQQLSNLQDPGPHYKAWIPGLPPSLPGCEVMSEERRYRKGNGWTGTSAINYLDSEPARRAHHRKSPKQPGPMKVAMSLCGPFGKYSVWKTMKDFRKHAQLPQFHLKQRRLPNEHILSPSKIMSLTILEQFVSATFSWHKNQQEGFWDPQANNRIGSLIGLGGVVRAGHDEPFNLITSTGSQEAVKNPTNYAFYAMFAHMYSNKHMYDECVDSFRPLYELDIGMPGKPKWWKKMLNYFSSGDKKLLKLVQACEEEQEEKAKEHSPVDPLYHHPKAKKPPKHKEPEKPPQEPEEPPEEPEDHPKPPHKDEEEKHYKQDNESWPSLYDGSGDPKDPPEKKPKQKDHKKQDKHQEKKKKQKQDHGGGVWNPFNIELPPITPPFIKPKHDDKDKKGKKHSKPKKVGGGGVVVAGGKTSTTSSTSSTLSASVTDFAMPSFLRSHDISSQWSQSKTAGLGMSSTSTSVPLTSTSFKTVFVTPTRSTVTQIINSIEFVQPSEIQPSKVEPSEVQALSTVVNGHTYKIVQTGAPIGRDT